MAGLVSVVVPIYNVERYLYECLDSVSRQTYRDLEIICVDDGSTDGSVAIAEQFVRRDPRFRLVGQPNAGLSAARNTGVPLATGEYLCFLDSDDVVPDYAYQLLIDALNAQQADFAAGNVRRLTLRGTTDSYPHGEIFRQTSLDTHVSRNHALLRDRTIWNKMFRRELYSEWGLVFPEGRLYEDTPVSVPSHALANRMAMIDTSVYYWRRRDLGTPSITQVRGDLKSLHDRFHSVRSAATLLHDLGFLEIRDRYHEVALWDEVGHFFAHLPEASEDFREAFLKESHELLEETGPQPIARLAPHWRQRWELVHESRMDELVELMRAGRAPDTAAAPKRQTKPVLATAVHDASWRDGRLHVRGHAFADGAGARLPFSSLRLVWLTEEHSKRRVAFPTWPRKCVDATGHARDDRHGYDWSGFDVSINPRSLREHGRWKPAEWTVAVASTGGLRLVKGALRDGLGGVPALRACQVEPGVTIVPSIRDGALRVRVYVADAWASELREDDGHLEVEGVAPDRGTGPLSLRVCLAPGLPAHEYPAETAALHNGQVRFTGRIPIADLAVADDSASHLSGLDARRYRVEVGDDSGWSSHLAVASALDSHRVFLGSDEVYSHVSNAGYLWICTRPAAPAVTDARWLAGGALQLTGDWPAQQPAEIILRLKAHRRDVRWPVEPFGDGWRAVLHPADVASLSGRRPLLPGWWSLVISRLVNGAAITADLAFTDRARRQLPVACTYRDRRFVLESDHGERAGLRVGSDLQLANRPRVATPVSARPATSTGQLRDALVLDAFGGRYYGDSPRAILTELRRREAAAGGPALEAAWVVDNGQAEPDGCQALRRGGPEWREALRTSRYVVTNDRLPGWFERRPGQVVLQTGRGWPVRAVGAAARTPLAGDRSDGPRVADAAQWSALLSPSRFATGILRGSYAYDGEVLEVGKPGNDLLFQPDRADRRAALLAAWGVPPDATAVLYAPTWRQEDIHGGGRAETARLLDLAELADTLPPGQVLLLRRHPMLLDDVPPAGPRVIDVSDHQDPAELLLAADVLISDYSSMIADFANTRRPILLYAPDLEIFTAMNGLNVDLAQLAPGPLLRTAADTVSALHDLQAITAAHAQRYQAFVSRFCDLDDGAAAARVVDWLLTQP